MKIAHKSIDEFLNDIATKPKTPAGGCTAALCAASCVALIEMVATHTLNNKNKSEEVKDYMNKVIKIASDARKEFLDYMDVDSNAYKKVIDAQKNNKDDIQEYYKNSVNIPLEMAIKISDMINMIKKTIQEGNSSLVTDGVAALLMARVTLDSLIHHIKFNLMYIEDKDFEEKIIEKLQFI